MSRLPRILFNVLTVMSLSLCLAVLVSCWKPLVLSSGTEKSPTYRYAALLHGFFVYRNQSIRLYHAGEELSPFTSSDSRAFGFRNEKSRRIVSTAGPAGTSVQIITNTEFRIDSDWLVLVAAPLPILRLYVEALRQKRARRWTECGRCPACSYDLRATPGRCPECGLSSTVFPSRLPSRLRAFAVNSPSHTSGDAHA